MKGIVLRSTGSFYNVLSEGKHYICRVRGKIRLEGIKETNPVAVGDWVTFEMDNGAGSISAILPRKNHMLRQSVKKTGHTHVLAANVDQVMVIATLAMPRTSMGFIDRVLVSAEAFGIPQVIVLNKRDLLDEAEQREVARIQSLYTAIGTPCYVISALQDDLELIRNVLAGKTTLIAGHSGVGKSTLLNNLAPDIAQAVGEVSDFSSKGIHTTTFAEAFEMGAETFVIDTPGVKEWGLVDMSAQEISDYFPEMREIRTECKFQSRCLHVNEPGCAIKAALEKGDIAQSRYESYVRMLDTSDNRK